MNSPSANNPIRSRYGTPYAGIYQNSEQDLLQEEICNALHMTLTLRPIFRAVMAVAATFLLGHKAIRCDAYVDATPLVRFYRSKASPIFSYKNSTRKLEDQVLKPVPDSNCLFANDWLILVSYADDIANYLKPKVIKLSEYGRFRKGIT